ncbi:MAG: aldo/keto reductase [Leptolyngbyaceae cyanobacterium]
MKTLTFSNGDTLPMLGLGTWKSDPGDVYKAIKEAIRVGYRHIDCAFIYGNEVEIGQALSESFAEGLVTREQLWVTSKLWNDCHAPADVQPALARTLADLKLDYLDLYLIHWPVVIKKGEGFPLSAEKLISLEELPILDTWQALEACVDQGLCRHIGVSNFSAAKLQALVADAKIKPEMNQVELHPYLQQPDLLAFCQSQNIHLTGYSPLGSPDRPAGLKAEDEPILLEDPEIVAIADRHNASPAQVLISWAIHRDTAVIPKSVTPVRIVQNLAAAELALTDEDMTAISALDRQRRYVSGAFWVVEGGPYTLENLWNP